HAAQASSVDTSINGQPCEQNDGYGVPRKFPGLFRRQGPPLDRPPPPGVVAQHPPIAFLKRPTSPPPGRPLLPVNPPVEKVIQRGLAAVEALPHMSAIESLDPPLSHAS